MALLWYLYGTTLVLIWHYFGTYMALLWYLYGTTLAVILHYFGTAMTLFWHKYGTRYAFFFSSSPILFDYYAPLPLPTHTLHPATLPTNIHLTPVLLPTKTDTNIPPLPPLPSHTDLEKVAHQLLSPFPPTHTLNLAQLATHTR